MNDNKERTFPRKVVISPGYGAGIATWCGDEGYDIAECPEFVEYIESDNRDEDEVARILSAAGFDGDDIYLGGLKNARVVTVNGPYYIREYDGFESIVEQSDGEIWRT